MGIYLMKSTLVLCQSWFPCLYVFPLSCGTVDNYKHCILSAGSVSNNICLLSEANGCLICLFIAPRSGFLGQIRILKIVFHFCQHKLLALAMLLMETPGVGPSGQVVFLCFKETSMRDQITFWETANFKATT